jgi:hypothetical protein
MSSFASPYLKSAPGVQGAKGYLIDGRGLVISSSMNLPQGTALPRPGLARAALSGRASGELGATFWAAAPVGAGTRWRVVFAAPRSTLLAPVQSSNTISWLLFGLFILAVLALVGLARAAIKQSAQLGSARERERAARELAHERLHDALTGLPNRQLFLDRTETALARARRTGRTVAVMVPLAEGVERPEQARELSELGYTLAQGFYFGRPMAAPAIIAALSNETRIAA